MMSPYVRVRTCRKTALGIWICRVSPSARFNLVGWNHVVKVLMLTLAFTCSRNLSQAFAVSRSRPTWVAVVMVRDKKGAVYYFHRCVKAVESNFTPVVSSASGFLAVPGAMPLCPGRDLLGFVGLHAAALKTARDCLRLNCAGQGKSVRRSRTCCTRDAQVFHRRKCAQFFTNLSFFSGFLAKTFREEKILHKSPITVLRKSRLLRIFFVWPVEQVETQGIAPNNQLILLDENGISLQPRSLRGINLVSGASVPCRVEVQQVVVQRNPHLSVRMVHSQSRQHAPEERLFCLLFLPLDFFPHRHRRRERVDRRVLNVLPSVAQVVVLSYRRLRQVPERIIKMSLRVGAQLTDIQETIQIRALGNGFRIAELPYLLATLVEDHDQVRFPQRRNGDLLFRQSR